ncbi:MAG TPA: hypothetical protein ENI59_01365 [Euryarchaeota archaeon]|nr:hypothetical protein [Euryarchaeota archaeon]
MSFKNYVKGFITSIWLGLKITLNWARSPLIYITYALVLPIASVFLVIFMYWAVGYYNPQALAHVIVGQTHAYVLTDAIATTSWVIEDDREHYKVLKYMFITPFSYYLVIIGRALSHMLIALVGVIYAFILFYAYHLPISLNVALYVYSLSLGIIASIALGLTLASIIFVMPRGGQVISRSLQAIFYVFSGAVYPLTVLPEWARWISYGIPVTYWYSLLRRSILGYDTDPLLVTLYNNDLMTRFLISTIIFIVFSYIMYRVATWRAKKAGRLELISSI